MNKQIFVFLAAVFAAMFFFTACTDTADKAKIQESAPAEVVAPVAQDTMARADSTAAKVEKGEKEAEDDDDDDDKKK